MSEEKVIEYPSDELIVEWRPKLCYHSENCVKGLPNVFKPKERRWIQTEHASDEELMKVIDRCPSGALSYRMKEQELKEAKHSENMEIQILPNGPILINSTTTIQLTDGSKVEKEKAALCRCGASSNKPYCDGSHNKIEFKD